MNDCSNLPSTRKEPNKLTYTVKQLAELSGISVRTLHWYDEIGLLKPGFCGANGYRYYEEEQLLLLQQILFFRELGFSLSHIRQLISMDDFDRIRSLQSHRSVLEEEIAHRARLVATIDKTLLHLKGDQIMESKELYYGFDTSRQKEYEQYLVKYYGTHAEELLEQSRKPTAQWNEAQWHDVKNQGDALHRELASAIDAGLSPESDEVQKIIHRHYQLQSRFFDITREVYIGLTQLYAAHPDFRKFFDVYHPQMIPFIGEAMRSYADKNL